MHNLREIGGKMPGAAEGEEVVVEGRVPPHDLDAEAAVLSAILIMDDSSEEVRARRPIAFDSLAQARRILRPEYFYSEAHRRIYEACVEVASKGSPVDVVLVATWLRDHDRLAQVGGMVYLTEILNAAPAVANVAAYAKVVYEKWRVRQMILACQRIVSEGYAGYGETQVFLDKAEDAVSDIARGEEPAPAPPAPERQPADGKCPKCKGTRWVACESCSDCGCVVCAGTKRVRCTACKPQPAAGTAVVPPPAR
jgi:hypothetical protein